VSIVKFLKTGLLGLSWRLSALLSGFLLKTVLSLAVCWAFLQLFSYHLRTLVLGLWLAVRIYLKLGIFIAFVIFLEIGNLKLGLSPLRVLFFLFAFGKSLLVGVWPGI